MDKKREIKISENEGLKISNYELDGEKYLTNSECNKLESLLSKLETDKKNIVIGRNEVKFYNYVGYIDLGTCGIELYPKADYNYSSIINMLNEVYDLNIKVINNSNTMVINESLIEIIAKNFVSLLLKEVSVGIYKSYTDINDDSNFIKGKLNIGKQINNDLKMQPYFNITFNDFNGNNYLNQTYMYTLKLLRPKLKSLSTIDSVDNCLEYFQGIECTSFNIDFLDKYKFNKQNLRFEKSFVLAKFIIKNISTYPAYGNNNSFSMLFLMHDLFEKYIFSIIRKYTKYYVRNQDRTHKLAEGLSIIKPDIIVTKDKNEEIIIDTKWKYFSSNYQPASSDQYQIYSYLTAYKKAQRAILLYPKINGEDIFAPKVYELMIEQFIGKRIEAVNVNYIDKNELIQQLEKIIDGKY